MPIEARFVSLYMYCDLPKSFTVSINSRTGCMIFKILVAAAQRDPQAERCVWKIQKARHCRPKGYMCLVVAVHSELYQYIK